MGRREVFEAEGWVFLPGFVDARTVERLRRAADVVAGFGAGLREDTTITGAHLHVQSASGRRGEPAVEPGALRKVVFPSKLAPEIAKLRRDARVLDLMRELGLREPTCVVDQLNLKAPRVGTGFPWHQDARFVTSVQQDVIARSGGANVVIALDDADENNGGFEVLSRTHLHGPKDFDYDTSTTNAGVFDESGRTLVPLRPGDAVAFHPYLAHGSGPNRDDRPRRLVALWFLGARATRPEPAGPQ